MAFNNTLSYQNSTQPLSCDKISSPMAEAFPPTIIGLVVLLLGSSWMFFLFGMQRGIRGAFKLIMEADEALYRERPSDIVHIKLRVTMLDIWKGSWTNRGMEVELESQKDHTASLQRG